MVRRLVRNRCVARKGLPPLLPLATTFTIQLVPTQSALMVSGASLARSAEVMSRPWLFS